MTSFNGPVLFLDRSDINTDEIIPAKYLTENSKIALKPYCLEDLKLEGFDAKRDIAGKAAIITRSNFGCGSSREHAPWALEVNGIRMVIAENFARIFRQNMFNCGLLAISLPAPAIDQIFTRFSSKECRVSVNLETQLLRLEAPDDTMELEFAVDPFDRELVRAGGWVSYADRHY